jgi:orotate phosphoribosyltransferase
MTGREDPSRLRQELVELIRGGLLVLDEPVALASGELSRYFIDGKAALSRGDHLRLACTLLIEALAAERIAFDAVGGLTMGADPLAHGVAILKPDAEWFSVRKEPKGRGTNRLIEGAKLGPASRVVLVEDVVTMGGSIRKAYDAVVESGASVAAAAAVVDRADVARSFFEGRGVRYLPLLTYEDLGIPAVGTEVASSGAPK